MKYKKTCLGTFWPKEISCLFLGGYQYEDVRSRPTAVFVTMGEDSGTAKDCWGAQHGARGWSQHHGRWS